MSEGLTAYVALLLAFAICIVHPGYLSLAIVGFVLGAIVYESSRPAEDGERSEERDPW